MTEYARYRGTRELAAHEVRRLAVQIARETRVMNRSSAQLSELADQLIAAGVAQATPNTPGAGYTQILALVAGLLLLGAGANVSAAAQTVAGRDAAALEALNSNILARLRAAAGNESPPPVSGEAPRAEESSGVPAVDSQASNTVSEAMSGDASDGQDNGPLAFLRGMLDGELRRIVRNATLEDRAASEPPDHAATVDAPRAMASRSVSGIPMDTALGQSEPPSSVGQDIVRVRISDDATLVISGKTAQSCADPAARADLIRAFAVALERRFR